MKAQVNVTAATVVSRPTCTPANLENIRSQARAAAESGAELVMFPELSVTGFLPNHPNGDHACWLRETLNCAWRTAETLDGRAVHSLIEISREAGLLVAAGMMENAGNVLYNSFVLVGAGRLQGYWRKMHIPLFEMQVYSGGGVPQVVDTPLGRIGVNICFDALLPESTRLVAVQGCEILLLPFAADPPPGTAAAWAKWAKPVVQARCAENGMFGVASNYAGDVTFASASQLFPGGAMIAGPDGSIIAEGEQELLSATLEAEKLLEARSAFEYTFRFRRPELYQSLTEILPG